MHTKALIVIAMLILFLHDSVQAAIGDDTRGPPKIHALTDDQITINVQKALVSDNTQRAADVTVKTENGVVTLAGSVEKSYYRSMLETRIKSVWGVKKVVNNIEIKNNQPKNKSA